MKLPKQIGIKYSNYDDPVDSNGERIYDNRFYDYRYIVNPYYIPVTFDHKSIESIKPR